MEYRNLGKTGLKVSSIGMGCVTFGREIDNETSFQILDRAYERGITLFDTSAIYGDGASEVILGEWISRNNLTNHEPATEGKQGEFVMATKVAPPLDKESVRKAVETSLRSLRMPTVDLYQLHSWDDDNPLEETLETLKTLHDEGKVQHIGCSNFTPEQLRRSIKWQTENGSPRFETIQPMYNLVNREIESELIPFCQEQDIGIISYSPLGAGFLTGKYSPNKPFPKGTRFDIKPGHTRHYYSPFGFQVVDHLRAASERLGVPIVQVALWWTINQPGITSVLIGGRKQDHVDQAFTAESLNLDFSPL